MKLLCLKGAQMQWSSTSQELGSTSNPNSNTGTIIKFLVVRGVWPVSLAPSIVLLLPTDGGQSMCTATMLLRT